MSAKRLQWILAFLTVIGGGVFVYAQNPVSISQVGTTPVTTTVPVSGTVTANMGTVAADPFGANADAASATGSISAKLRFIANTGIPITGTVTVGTHAVTQSGGPWSTNLTQLNSASFAATNFLPVRLTDGSNYLTQDTQLTHDGAMTVGSTTGGATFFRASAAAPTDVSADNDAVLPWALRSGAQVVQPSYAGTLASTGNGASGGGVPRVTIANDSTGVLATVSTVTTLTGSGIAHDAADSGNPHKIGFKATTSLSGKTMVANDDRTDAFAGVDGVQIVRPYTNLEDALQDRATNTDGASTAFAGGLAAAGSGIRIWLTACTLSNSSASFITVDLRDGSGGSVLWTVPVPATGGAHVTWEVPLKFTANTAVAYDASAATTTLTISCNGFKSKI